MEQSISIILHNFIVKQKSLQFRLNILLSSAHFGQQSLRLSIVCRKVGFASALTNPKVKYN